MPTRARRRCTATGCREFASKSGRCDGCEIPRPRPKSTPRPSSTALGYDYRWRKLSEAYLRAHRTCVVPGCGRQSQHTDHVDGDRTNWEPHNLQALCLSCHSRKTALHDGGFGNKRTPR